MEAATGNSNFKTGMLIIVSTLGSGIAYMPSVNRNFGPMLACIGVCGIGILTYFSLVSLVCASRATRESPKEKLTYSQVASKISNKLAVIVSFTLVISSLAAGFGFISTFGNMLLNSLRNIDKVDNLLTGTERNSNGVLEDSTNFKLAKMFIIGVVSVIYYFLFQLKDLSSLSILSKFSLFSVLFFSSAICAFGIINPVKESEMAVDPNSSSPPDMFSSFSMVIFALHCQFSFLDIYNSMANTDFGNVNFVLSLTCVVAVLLYSAIGFFGFRSVGEPIGNSSILSFFASTKDPSNREKDNVIMLSLIDRYGETFGKYLPQTIYTAYLLVYFGGVAFNIFGTVPIIRQWILINGKQAPRKLVAFILASFLFLSGGFADFVLSPRGLDKVFAIIGSLLTTPLSFLFPGIFVIYTTRKMGLMKIGAIFTVILSIGLMVGLTAGAIKDDVANFFSDKKSGSST